MMIIDKRKIYDVIDNRRPHSVALNGPEGLVSKIQEIADKDRRSISDPCICYWRYLLGVMRLEYACG